MHISDAAAAFISVGIFVAHYAFLRYEERRDPRYTLQALLEDSRVAWVERMTGQKEGILAVQTLRNQMMAATFFASTAILLIAFGFFAQVIRLLSHVSMLVSVPSSVIEARQVAALLLQAGRYHARGVRCYYYAFPLLFWLFGPLMFVGSSVALVALILELHRAPRRGAGSAQVQLGV